MHTENTVCNKKYYHVQMLRILWNPKKKTKPGVKWPHVWSESLQLSELHFLICKNGMPAALLPPQGCHKKQVMDNKVCNSTLDTKKCWILSRPCELLSSTFSLSKPKRSSLLYPLQPENLTSSIGSSLDSGLPIIIEQISGHSGLDQTELLLATSFCTPTVRK